MPKPPCHYCGERSESKDHIVARHWLPKRGKTVPQFAAMANKVPACHRCNNNKSHYRALCECVICESAWLLLAPYILPRRKRDIPTISLEKIRGEAA